MLPCCYNINRVLNRQNNKCVEPIATVPKKNVFLVLPFLGFQSEVLARRVKFCVSKFYAFLGLFLITLAGLSLSFHTKTVLAALKDRKYFTRVVLGTAVLSTSVKLNDDYMIGRLNISRLSHKIVTPPLWLTMKSLPVTSLNGTMLKSSLLRSPTDSAKIRKLF